MEKKIKKHDEKKTEKSKDRGDKMNLLVKVLEDLDIKDFLPNRDRGDSKYHFGNRSSKNLCADQSATNQRKQKEYGRKKIIETSASEVKTKKDYFLDSDDSSKKHHSKIHKENKMRLDESKGKTAMCTVKDFKTKTEQRARAVSEQRIKSKSDYERMDEVRRIDDRMIIIDVKVKIMDENTKASEEVKRIDKIRNMRLPPGKDLKFIEIDALERRKLLWQKYTVKLKGSNKNMETKMNVKDDDYELENGESEIFDSEKLNESPKEILQLLETNKLTRKTKEIIQRKPIIKTIRNTDHKVYKAVTFIDQKETTPLQIKMPISKKSVETNTVKKLKTVPSKISTDNIKEKPAKKKEKRFKRLKRRPSSPAFTTYQASPPTEVAKWAPSSINQHTKPYYEAWVDTTLAAITKCSEKDKLKYNKQQIFKTFKRAFDLDSRPNSPHLVYEKINDEKYMGRITVNKSK